MRKQNQWQKIQGLQQLLARETCWYAYSRSAWYRQLWDRWQLHPKDLTDWQVFGRWPQVEIDDWPEGIQLTEEEYWNGLITVTDGRGGRRLVPYTSKDKEQGIEAYQTLFQFAGIGKGDKVVICPPLPGLLDWAVPALERLGALPVLIEARALASTLVGKEPTVLIMGKEQLPYLYGLPLKRLLLVWLEGEEGGLAEAIQEARQISNGEVTALVQPAWLPFPAAITCEKGSIHWLHEHVLAQQSPGNRLLLTSLRLQAWPLIRYVSQLKGIWSTSPCACGRDDTPVLISLATWGKEKKRGGQSNAAAR
ncbi:MAG: hypothetical protein ACOY3H_07020 [Bacillota bacterium]